MQTADLIKLALQEDLEHGDVTTESIFEEADPKATAFVKANQAGIICGIDFFVECYKQIDPSIKFRILKSNGQRVNIGDNIIRLHGKTSSILKGERSALNFLGHLSGISTLTSKYVQAVRGTTAIILDTRKTTPAYRLLEKFAVRIGGGKNHRFSLYDMALIKDNHIDACGSIKNAVEKIRYYLKNNEKGHIQIEVEVKNLHEFHEALDCNVDRIMLDNMSLEYIKKCVKLTNGRTKLEASGNVNLSTIRAIAETGIDFISVGKLTHSADNFDFSMRFQK